MNKVSRYNYVRWRCRRGMRELDYLFMRWLEQQWPLASAAEQALFEEILSCEDDTLWRWLMGYEPCPHARYLPLLANIASAPTLSA